MPLSTSADVRAVRVPVELGTLEADLVLPRSPIGLVIFAHGSGSSRHSPRNQFVAGALQAEGMATLLADLLTLREEAVDHVTGHLRFDIPLLGRRVLRLLDWASTSEEVQRLPIGLFGASTGAAAALVAAAARPDAVSAVVSRGGRPDLAGSALKSVEAPTLLLVGGFDTDVIALNRAAEAEMQCPVSLEIVPGASHLFEEPGTLDRVAARAATWFTAHLPQAPGPRRRGWVRQGSKGSKGSRGSKGSGGSKGSRGSKGSKVREFEGSKVRRFGGSTSLKVE
jgi:dienelactone hydrolase